MGTTGAPSAIVPWMNCAGAGGGEEVEVGRREEQQ